MWQAMWLWKDRSPRVSATFNRFGSTVRIHFVVVRPVPVPMVAAAEMELETLRTAPAPPFMESDGWRMDSESDGWMDGGWRIRTVWKDDLFLYVFIAVV